MRISQLFEMSFFFAVIRRYIPFTTDMAGYTELFAQNQGLCCYMSFHSAFLRCLIVDPAKCNHKN